MNEKILNPYYSRLPESYLFSTIAARIAQYRDTHPSARIIRLGIGDVTRPLVPAVVEAMHAATDEMAKKASFRGYGPEQGYAFLREAVVRGEYASRNVDVSPDEVFISDGSKCDVANFQELFSSDCRVAIPDPVYPVYLDSNVMAGRSGNVAPDGHFDGVVYLAADADNDFQPSVPDVPAEIIYLCSPNNPTGTVLTRATLEKFVEYALAHGSVILFDAAYSAYIRDEGLPHSIYEIPGAKKCAVEFRSFSKTAGFTGVRCACTVVPHEMPELHAMWLRRQTTKFNGVNYIVQRGAEAVYSEAGNRQIREVVAGYMANAAKIRAKLAECGHTVYGGEHAPYIWWKLAGGEKSFDFFDRLLETCEVVGTPGSGFGPRGEGYFRLTAFGDPEETELALLRIAAKLSR
ncbi:LL-diaminopimelate aminotransferase [Candidatus Spyradosoma sp. SGI.093]|uniref:LL-diaminopimelate aminotransferase n=1 Tax=Candidatus Spyradosoma sp. SGI.093 TaxID=3420583 RepID=UPI003D07DFD7